MVPTYLTKFSKKYFNLLIAFTLSISLVEPVLFHLCLILIFIFVIAAPAKLAPPPKLPLAFWFLIQFPIVIVLRATLEPAISFPFLEKPFRWVLLCCLLIWIPKKELSISPDTIYTGVGIGAILACIVAIFQVEVLDVGRATAYHHPINFGFFSGLYSLISLWGILRDKVLVRKTNIFYAIACFAGVYALFLSVSRGPLLAYLGTLFLMLGLRFIGKGISRNNSSFIILVTTLIIGTSFYVANKTNFLERTQNEISTYLESGSLTSSGARLEMWKFSIDAFLQQPIIGVGPNYRTQQREPGKYINYNPNIGKWAHSHNEFFDAAARNGLIGICSLLIAMSVWLTQIKTAKYKVPLIICSYWALGGLTQVYTHHVIGATLIPLLIILILLNPEKEEENSP